MGYLHTPSLIYDYLLVEAFLFVFFKGPTKQLEDIGAWNGVSFSGGLRWSQFCRLPDMSRRIKGMLTESGGEKDGGLQ